MLLKVGFAENGDIIIDPPLLFSDDSVLVFNSAHEFLIGKEKLYSLKEYYP